MNAPLSSARENYEFYLNDPELAATLPAFPKLLNGIRCLPYGRDGVLLIGGKDAHVIKGQNARLLLASLLPLLDGLRPLDTISECIPAILRPRANEMVALLSHRGLLENGPGEQVSPSHLGDFISKYINVSRHYKHYSHVLTDIGKMHLLVVASPKVCAELAPMFAELNLRGLTMHSSADIPDTDDIDFVLGIEDSQMDDLFAIASLTRLRGIPFFFGAIDNRSIQIGPLIMSRLSGSYACMKADQIRHDTPNVSTGAGTEADFQFWLACIYHQFVISLTKTTVNPPLNVYRRFSLDSIGYTSEVVHFAQAPGIVGSPLASYPVFSAAGATAAWELHSRIRMPPKSLSGPSLYFKHYTLSNRTAITAERPRFHTNHLVRLPEPRLSPVPGPLNLGKISYMLANSYGMQQRDDGARLLAPSGGSLGSPDAYLVVRDIDGLEPGLYRYRNAEHILEVLSPPNTTLFLDAIGQQGSEQHQAYLVGIGAYGRVAGKYGEMAFKVINLDSGVVQWYSHWVAQQCGVRAGVVQDANADAIMDILGLPTANYFYTHMLALGEPVELKAPRHGTLTLFSMPLKQGSALPKPRPILFAQLASEGVQQIMRTRRATRRFFPKAPEYDTLVSMLHSGAQQLVLSEADLHAPQDSGADYFTLWVVCPFGVQNGDATTESGLYRFDQVAGELVLVSQFASEEALRFSNQDSLASASAMVIVTMNMAYSLQNHGGAAYRRGFQATGRALADLWLHAEAYGYQGTISGGVLDDGLIEYGGSDGFDAAAMAMFVFGHVNLDAVARDHAQY
jgi:SagB-type dehydrogenase family enzyme